jgi:retron-type reverse transcriptase
MKIETKTQPISYYQVAKAYKSVKKGGKAVGIDGKSMLQFEARLNDNLYKLWNRMTSGSYMPPAVRRHEIPKSDGSKRLLGIPTITDRIAQKVVKDNMEPKLERIFHPSSFGYRPGKNAHQAIRQCIDNCRKYE